MLGTHVPFSPLPTKPALHPPHVAPPGHSAFSSQLPAHAVHWSDAGVIVPKKPALHAHAVTLVAPVLVVLVWSGQALHDCDAALSEYVPRAQGRHAPAEGDAYVPAGHAVQLPPATLTEPALHGLHAAALDWPSRPSVLVPLAHSTQTALPLAYVLTG